MILLYTGAASPNDAQNQAERSLGGYVSSSQIPNGMSNSIFSTISKSVIEKNKRDTRLLALKNTTGQNLTGVQIWVEKVDSSYSNVKIAAVEAATDIAGNPYFEQLQNAESIPYQAVLELHDGTSRIDVGDLADGQTIGIWLSREIDATVLPSTSGTTANAISVMQAELTGQIVSEDNSNLRITWS